MANIDLRKRSALESDIDAALANSVSSLPTPSRTPQEPDYIAALTCYFPSLLKGILSSHILKLNFSVCGCYIHQKPKVEFYDPGYRKAEMELGDLLIVYKEDNGSEVLYNSLLLQAKMVKNRYPQTIARRERHQLTLYEKWPQFRYVHLPLKGKIRNIYPKTIHTGAQYLLIDSKSSIVDFWCATANKQLYPAESLACQLIRLIEFQVGDTFVSKTEPVIDDWSKMVWDLLEISKDSKFNRKRSNLSEEPRANRDLIEEFIEQMLDNSKKEKKNAGNEEEENEQRGISIILIKGELNSVNKNKQNI